MKRRLQDLERSGMIKFESIYHTDGDAYHAVAHDIYERFAKWYVTNHGVKWLKNTWCVFQTQGSGHNQDHVASDLVRLRMFDQTRTSARLLTSNTMQGLQSLEVLQLCFCSDLKRLSLEGLGSLRHLELVGLEDLVVVTLTRSANTAKSGGIFESLQYVMLEDLASLVHGPDVRLCTFLYWYYVKRCPSMTNLDEMECPHLKVLELYGLVADQLKRLPDIVALHSLECFFLDVEECYIALTDVEVSRRVELRDLRKPYLRVVKELFAYLRTEWVADHILGRRMRSHIYWSKASAHSEYLDWQDSTGECCFWK